MSRVCGLVRISSESSAERGYSAADQEQAIRAYADQGGHEVVEVVADLGVSGKAIDRPGLDRIEQLIQAGQIDQVVFVRLDRLSREPWRALQLLSDWRERGVTPVSLDRPNPGRTALDRMLESIDASVSDLEWERIRERLMRGRREKAETGRIPIRLDLYGYRQVRRWQEHLAEYAGRSGELEIEPSEAAVIVLLFERYGSGWSLAELARWAGENGVTGRRGNATWTPTHIRKYLRNEAYAGTFWYGRERHTQQRGTKTVKREPRPFSEWLSLPVPALIPRDLWTQVQERLNANAETRAGAGRPSDAWPLQGLLFCGHCRGVRDQPMGCTYHKTRKREHSLLYAYLTCNSWYRKDLEWCGLRCRAEPVAERVYAHALRRLEAGELEAGAVIAAEARLARRDQDRRELERVESELAELGRAEARLEDLVLAGARPERVRTRMLELQTQRGRLLPLHERLRAALDAVADPSRVRIEARARTERWLELLRAAENDPPELRKVYRGLLTVRLFSGPRVQVRFR